MSWEVGQSLADSLVQRYLQDTGEYRRRPRRPRRRRATRSP
ncbi:hypothetical protein ACWDRX_29140 [Streptomyces nigra]